MTRKNKRSAAGVQRAQPACCRKRRRSISRLSLRPQGYRAERFRVSSFSLSFDPGVHALAQHADRQMAFGQNRVMEGAQIETCAQALRCLDTQLEDRELADLVTERLCGPGHVAEDLNGCEAFGLAAFLDQVRDRL